MNKSQEGFALVEGLLLLAIVAVVSGVGWYAIHTKHQTDKILSQADKISQNTPVVLKGSAENSSQQSASLGYLAIKEWDIKVKLGTADPSIVSYKIQDTSNCLAGPCSGTAALSLNTKVKPECGSLGIGINRRTYDISTKLPSGRMDVGKRVGNYWYDVSGGPASCGDAQSDALRAQYLGNNPSSWEYSAL